MLRPALIVQYLALVRVLTLPATPDHRNAPRLCGNAGIDASTGGSPKGEEEEPRAPKATSQDDATSSAGSARYTAALEAQGADSGSEDELNLGAMPQRHIQPRAVPGQFIHRRGRRVHEDAAGSVQLAVCMTALSKGHSMTYSAT